MRELEYENKALDVKRATKKVSCDIPTVDDRAVCTKCGRVVVVEGRCDAVDWKRIVSDVKDSVSKALSVPRGMV